MNQRIGKRKINCIKYEFQALMKRVKRCAGASAGSLAAALWTFQPDDAEVT